MPLTEEIRLEIFGSQDSPVFPAFFRSDGDSVYSRENSFEILRTPEKTCLIRTGTLRKLVGSLGSRNYFKSDFLRLWLLSRQSEKASKRGLTCSVLQRIDVCVHVCACVCVCVCVYVCMRVRVRVRVKEREPALRMNLGRSFSNEC